MNLSWLTSCFISSIGNKVDRSSGPIGSLVPGLSGGERGVGISGMILYHFFGISFSSRIIFVCFIEIPPDLSVNIIVLI